MADKSNATERKRPSLIWEWTKSLVIAIGIALLIRWPLIEPFKIPSGSMEPTLQIGRID
jgi:signal peptidase I